MKKLLLSLVALMTFGVSAWAQELSVEKVQVREGNSGTAELVIKTNGKSFRDAYFELQLPEGITVQEIREEDGEDVIITHGALGSAASSRHTLADNIVSEDGEPQLVKYVISTTVDGAYIKNDGVLVSIGLIPDASLTVGKTLKGKIQGSILTDEAATSYTVDDFEFDIEIVENVIILDENSTTLPEIAENQNVLVKRTIKANEWSTLCLPFDMTAEQVTQVFGSDAKFATFASYTKDGGNASTSQKFTATSINLEFETYDWSEDGIFANVPYLMKSSNDITTFELEGVTINPAEDDANIPYKRSGKVVGTSYGTLHAGDYVPQYGLFLSGGNFWYSQGKTIIKGFRGYFVLNDILADLSSTAGIKMQVNVDGEPTGVNGLQIVNAAEGVYTIDGKKMNNDATKLQKGVYIIDGKKVAIK